MRTVVVDRNTWLRGEGPVTSKLHRSKDNKQCCIGFVARELGATVEDITDRSSLSESLYYKKQGRKVSTIHSSLSFGSFITHYKDILQEAYGCNDNIEITDDERENLLIKIGYRMGINFVFKNGRL